MCLWVVRDLVELVDDVLRRGLIGVSHAEVDDVGALPAQLHLSGIDLAEHVGRQALDSS